MSVCPVCAFDWKSILLVIIIVLIVIVIAIVIAIVIIVSTYFSAGCVDAALWSYIPTQYSSVAVLCVRTGGTLSWSTYSRNSWSPDHVCWRPTVIARRTSRDSSTCRMRLRLMSTFSSLLLNGLKPAQRRPAVVLYICGVSSSLHKVINCHFTAARYTRWLPYTVQNVVAGANYSLPTVDSTLQCCIDFIGCQSRDVWNFRLRILYTNRSLQRHQRTCLPTFDTSPNRVVLISVHLLTGYWFFHRRIPALEQKFCCCGTAPVEHCAIYVMTRRVENRSSAMDSLGNIWAHLFRA